MTDDFVISIADWLALLEFDFFPVLERDSVMSAPSLIGTIAPGPTDGSPIYRLEFGGTEW